MQDFRKLNVWEKAHKLTLQLYKNSKQYPREELYSLTSQIRRASASIPTNIAEGCVRGSDKDFARFLQIAMGSASEVEYLLLLSYDLSYISKNTFTILTEETINIKKMLSSLLKTLKAERRVLTVIIIIKQVGE